MAVNQAWQRLWGKDLADVATRDIRRDPQHRSAGVVPELQRGLMGQPTELHAAAYTVRDPSSGRERQRWIRGQIYALCDRDGRPREAVVLHEDVTAQKYAEDAIHYIATGAERGDRFFEQLVENLAVLFQADHAYIGLLDPGDRREERAIEPLILWSDGEILTGKRYLLAGTPCEQAIDIGPRVYQDEVRTIFPGVPPLIALEAESYVGIAIVDSDRRPIGIMAVLSRSALDPDRRTREVLAIFAARAGAELQRQRDEARIRSMAYEDYLTRLGTDRLKWGNRTLELEQHGLPTLPKFQNPKRRSASHQ